MKLVAEGTFDAAHLLSNYEGKCKNLHGHTYKYEVEVEDKAGVKWETQMLVDFNDIKKLLDTYDHATLISEYLDSPEEVSLLEFVQEYELKHKVIKGSSRSTAERIAEQIKQEVSELLMHKVSVRVRLWETPKHCVEV